MYSCKVDKRCVLGCDKYPNWKQQELSCSLLPVSLWSVKNPPVYDFLFLSSSLMTYVPCKLASPASLNWCPSWGKSSQHCQSLPGCCVHFWPGLAWGVSPPPFLCRASSVSPLRCHRYWIKQVCYCRQTAGSILAWSCVWIGVSRALSGATPSDTAGARSNFDFHSSPRACRTP